MHSSVQAILLATVHTLKYKKQNKAVFDAMQICMLKLSKDSLCR